MAKHDSDHMERESFLAPKSTNTSKAVIASGPVESKRKTVLLRFARTLGASVLGVLAVWAAGPDALELVKDPTQQVILLSIVVPFLTAAEKSLRYGDEKGEDPKDTLL